MFTKKALVTLLICFFFTHNISTSDNDSQLQQGTATTDTPCKHIQESKRSTRISAALATCMVIVTGLVVNQAHYSLPNNQPTTLHNPQCPLQATTDCSLRSDTSYYPSFVLTQSGPCAICIDAKNISPYEDYKAFTHPNYTVVTDSSDPKCQHKQLLPDQGHRTTKKCPHYRTKKRAYQAWDQATTGKNISHQIVDTQTLVDTYKKRIAQSEKQEHELTSEIQELSEQFSHLSDSVGAWAMDLKWDIRQTKRHAENQREMYRQRIKEQQKQLQYISMLQQQCKSTYQMQQANKVYHQKSR